VWVVCADGFWSGLSQDEHRNTELKKIWGCNRPTANEVCQFEAPRRGDSDASGIVGTITASTLQEGRRVSTSTGLGLPLCRSFAVAGGGWVAITDAGAVDNPMLTPPVTQFWAVLPVEMVTSEANLAADSVDVKPEFGVRVDVASTGGERECRRATGTTALAPSRDGDGDGVGGSLSST
jgi:hypothetical protein